MSRESQDWMEKMARLDYIKPEELPNLDLYMDQVTNYMESLLAGTKRYPEDKVMTKTMINNYTKNKLLPPPDKKKYSKDHILMLIFIYYFKSFMSISDLQQILTPLAEYCFEGVKKSEEGPKLSEVYETIFQMEHDYYYEIRENIEKLRDKAAGSFEDVEGETGDFLRKFSFITLLSHDIYIRKQMIETLVDEMK